MTAREPLGVAVMGLGFMGRTHLEAYRSAAAAGFPNRLVAVCDPDRERRAGRLTSTGNLGANASAELAFDPATVFATDEVDALLARSDVALVSICTPTESHVALAERALAAGKHVLLEKPVALRSADAERLREAARSAHGACVPAMCMRFWPGWRTLLEELRRGTLGAPRSATFRRLGSRPTWSSFYADPERSGGALLDLHVHDVDFAIRAFGPPDAVHAFGDVDHLTAEFRYERGPAHVALEAGWDHSPGWPFRMGYTVVFERGTLEFDSTRAEPLQLTKDGRTSAVPLEPGTGYDFEVRHLLGALAAGTRAGLPTLDEAVVVLRWIERERDLLAR